MQVDKEGSYSAQVAGTRIVGDKDRERLAVVWTESSKVFKGEPYERALAWFYRGICHY